MGNIADDWHAKMDCKWFYDYYRITRYGVRVDCDCLKHQFDCKGCKYYEV